jgi:hypothetical protein
MGNLLIVQAIIELIKKMKKNQIVKEKKMKKMHQEDMQNGEN